jgi:DNA-binding GntR family transcriptional regulator
MTEGYQWDPTRPKWEQIAEAIRRGIADGTYAPHALISERWIQEEWGVAKVTARKAVAALRADGLLVTTPGMGSFVADRSDDGTN